MAIFKKVSLFTCIFVFLGASAPLNASYFMLVKPNVLYDVSAKEVGLAQQLTFNFSGPFHHSSSVEGSTLIISFPQARMDKIQPHDIAACLNKISLVEHADCTQTSHGLHCKIRFSPHHVVLSAPKKVGFNQLVCEIYAQKDLEKIKNASDGPLFHACTSGDIRFYC